MSKRTWMSVVLVSVAVAVGVYCLRPCSRVRVNVGELVVEALSNDGNGDYVARVSTEIHYNGEHVKTLATDFHHGKVEKIEYAGASGKRVWSMTRDGKSYTFLPNEDKLLVSEASRLISDEGRAKLLLKNYAATCLGMDNIAGRSAYVVRLSSRYEGRPGKKLWIDQKNFAILQSVDYSASGEDRGGMKTEQIDFNAKFNFDTFALPSSKAVKIVMVCSSGNTMAVFKNIGFSVGVPSYVPLGYKIEGYHLFYPQCSCDHRSAQLTYTDGLNVISVFQTPLMKSCKCCKVSSSGSRNKCVDENCGMAMTSQVTRKDKSVVVVGDLLPEDVRKIAESVD